MNPSLDWMYLFNYPFNIDLAIMVCLMINIVDIPVVKDTSQIGHSVEL